MEPFVVVITKPYMGENNQELGKILLQGFLRTVSDFERLPEAIMFYNDGVNVILDDVLQPFLSDFDLKNVPLLFCGTCLDYYDMELPFGSRSSMKEIVSYEMKYKVLRP